MDATPGIDALAGGGLLLAQGLDPAWLALAAAAAPVAGVLSVGVACAALSALAVAWGRGDPMDDAQARAFAGRRAGVARRLVWGVAVEGLWQTVAFALQAWRFVFPASLRRLEPAPDATPVLLLGGYLENSGLMALLGWRLRRRGHLCVPLDLPSTLRPIEDNARWLAERVDEVRARTGCARVAIVGHSMGGVIGRALVLAGAPSPEAPPAAGGAEPGTGPDASARAGRAVAVVVSIASPHRGTRMGRLGLGPSARDMSPGSDFLRRHPPDRRGSAPVHSILGFQENIVSPAWSSVLDPAAGETVVLDAPTGHVSPLFLAETADHVDRWLRAATTDALAPAQTGALAPAPADAPSGALAPAA